MFPKKEFYFYVNNHDLMKEQFIRISNDFRLLSIRKLVNDETSFTHPKPAIKILHHALVQKKEDRFIRAKQNRIRTANFPQKKLLKELSLKALPSQYYIYIYGMR